MTTFRRTICRATRPLVAEPHEGQGLVEYALIILLIAIATVGVVGGYGSAVDGLYTYILSNLPF
jgi:Flp pilus assembly pilin Flp